MNNVFRKIVLIEKVGRYDYERLNYFKYMMHHCERNNNTYGYDKFKSMFKMKLHKMLVKNIKKKYSK